MEAVSVVIPTYCSAPFIRRTLASVLAQTFAPSEIIVVDDASPDETAEIVRATARESSIPIRFYELESNTGSPAGPLNLGVGMARGPLIATLDHDDEMLPGKLASQAECMGKHMSVGLSFGRCELGPLSGERVAVVTRANAVVNGLRNGASSGRFHVIDTCSAYRALARHGNFVLTCSNMVFRRAMWEAAGGFDSRVVTASDFDLTVRIAARSDLAFVDEELVRWTAPVSSLHRAADLMRRTADVLRVYSRFDRRLLVRDDREAFEAGITRAMFDAVYELREAGDFTDAARLCLRAIREGRWVGGASVALLKVFGRMLGMTTPRRRWAHAPRA